MFNSIDEYLNALKGEMKDADPALIQDALSDAREHLTLALESVQQKTPEVSVPDALKVIVGEYGSPEETASAYQEVERRTLPPWRQSGKSNSIGSRFLGVYLDPRAWGSLLFMFVALVTGILYFTWAVTGLSLSLSFLILVIGLPFAILFLLSVQGLALLEGRLVEALLGERMPRRPPFAQPGLKWLERLKALVMDKHTWLSMLYLILQLPLGVVYFSLMVTLISLSLGVMVAPLVQLIWHHSILVINSQRIFLPYWALILLAPGGFLLLTSAIHMARTIGWLHGRYAKWMLVS
jgi:hypothetical protein